jgi:uncharacterized protein involved in type VI secretion and phage assembly
MMAANQNSLTLCFAGGGLKDLYPWDLELEEGISRLYRGKLVALSGTNHPVEELAELLDKKVSLSMSRRLRDGRVFRTRWLHGIVTAVASDGLIVGVNKQDCYRTVFTIEPELARLRYTRRTESFYRMNPADVAELILNHYGLKGNFSGEYIDRRKYGPNLMYEEMNENRFDFLDRLLRLYGISYTFCHPQTGDGRLGDAALHFSDGRRYPVSDVAYSDKRKVPEVERFDFLMQDEGQNRWKMDNWRMEQGIAAEGLCLSALYPTSLRGNNEWRRGKTGEQDRYEEYNSHFHSYPRETAEKEIDDDIRMILDTRRLAQELAKSRWEGDSEHTVFLPGQVFELSHFYGRKESRLITALVTAVKLQARTVWPADLAAPADSAEGEYLKAQAVCTDFGKDSPRHFVPVIY